VSNSVNEHKSESSKSPSLTTDIKNQNTSTQTEISVTKIPTLSVNTNASTDYVALYSIIGSFIIAILSFWITIYVIKKNSKDQLKIASDNSSDLYKLAYQNRSTEIQTWISTSRQNWINKLSDPRQSRGFILVSPSKGQKREAPEGAASHP
jgi:hypothetical protein